MRRNPINRLVKLAKSMFSLFARTLGNTLWLPLEIIERTINFFNDKVTQVLYTVALFLRQRYGFVTAKTASLILNFIWAALVISSLLFIAFVAINFLTANMSALGLTPTLQAIEIYKRLATIASSFVTGSLLGLNLRIADTIISENPNNTMLAAVGSIMDERSKIISYSLNKVSGFLFEVGIVIKNFLKPISELTPWAMRKRAQRMVVIRRANPDATPQQLETLYRVAVAEEAIERRRQQDAADRQAALQEIDQEAQANTVARRILTDSEKQQVTNFEKVLAALTNKSSFANVNRSIKPKDNRADEINWYGSELPLQAEYNKYAPDNYWGAIPNQVAVKNAEQDHPDLVDLYAGGLMSIPVYFMSYDASGHPVEPVEPVYMDLFFALNLLAQPVAKHPATRQDILLSGLRYAPEVHKRIKDLHHTLLHPSVPQAFEYPTFDAAVDAAITKQNIEPVFAYLLHRGGKVDGKLINWTTELKEEVAQSKYAAANYWDAKLSTRRRAAFESAHGELCDNISFQLIRIPLKIDDIRGIDLMQWLNTMQHREINPGANLALNSLGQVKFDGDKQNEIVTALSNTQPERSMSLLFSKMNASAAKAFTTAKHMPIDAARALRSVVYSRAIPG